MKWLVLGMVLAATISPAKMAAAAENLIENGSFEFEKSDEAARSLPHRKKYLTGWTVDSPADDSIFLVTEKQLTPADGLQALIILPVPGTQVIQRVKTEKNQKYRLTVKAACVSPPLGVDAKPVKIESGNEIDLQVFVDVDQNKPQIDPVQSKIVIQAVNRGKLADWVTKSYVFRAKGDKVLIRFKAAPKDSKLALGLDMIELVPVDSDDSPLKEVHASK